MATLTVDFDNSLTESVGQIRYALTFLSEDVVSYDIDEAERKIHIDFRQGADVEQMRNRVDQLLRRYSKPEFGMKSVVALDQRRALPVIDAWAGMLERRWATPVGEGHTVLRGPAAQLLALVDHKVQTMFVKEFGAELEIFPSTIKSETLHRCNHFTSFPEHMDFVAHLKQDLDILSDFAKACREDGWSSGLHDGRMS